MDADVLAENKRLQRCVTDLVGIMALPAMWIGREPAGIAGSLLDSLVEMLDLAVLRLNHPEADQPIEALRVSKWAGDVAPAALHSLLVSPDADPWALPRPLGLEQFSLAENRANQILKLVVSRSGVRRWRLFPTI